MHRWLKPPALALLLLAFIGPVGVLHAELVQPPLFQLAQLGPLPPDQRREMRQQMREHWQQMPREERQDLRGGNHDGGREGRRERRDGFQQMPQEDRSRVREELRGRRDNWQNGGPNGGQNGGPGGGFQQNDGRGGGHGRGRR